MTSRKPTSKKYAAKSRRLSRSASAARPGAPEPLHAACHVAVRAGFALQLQEHRERTRLFPCAIQRIAEIVQQPSNRIRRRRGRFGGAFEPVDGFVHPAARKRQT